MAIDGLLRLRIHGEVRDASGVPLQGVRLVLVDLSYNGDRGRPVEVPLQESDGTGRFEFDYENAWGKTVSKEEFEKLKRTPATQDFELRLLLKGYQDVALAFQTDKLPLDTGWHVVSFRTTLPRVPPGGG